MSRQKLILSIFLVMSAVLVTFSGCLDKAGTPTEPGAIDVNLPDDNKGPNRPLWKYIQPEVMFSNEDENGMRTRYFMVYLEWEKVTTNIEGDLKANIVGYKIYRDSTQKAVAFVPPETNMYEDKDLSALLENSTHTYYVSAVDSMMRETLSDSQVVELKVGGVFPTAPRNFFSITDGDHVTLYWQEPANKSYCELQGDEIVSYKVVRKEEGENWETLAIIPSTNHIFIDGIPKFDTHYDYQIFAITKTGNIGEGSDVRGMELRRTYREDLSLPTQPENLVLTPVDTGSPGSVKLNWKIPKWNDDGRLGTVFSGDVVAYKIYRIDSPTFNPSWAERQTYRMIAMVYNTTEFIDDTIDINDKHTYYYYRVSAVDAHDHESLPSHPVSYYLDVPTTATATPEHFYLVVEDDNNILFRWRLDKNIEKYYLWTSRNGKYFEQAKEIDAQKEFKYNDEGDIVEYNPGIFEVPTRDVRYFKLSCHDNVDHFRSNLSYYVRIEKVGQYSDNRLILYPADIGSFFQARSIHYAWYARQFFAANTDVAEESYWGYDMRSGLHYRAEQVTDGDTYFVLDSMGEQPPPSETPEQVFSAMSISEEILVEDYVYTDLSSTLTSELNASDSVRPMLKALSRSSTQDTHETYIYLSAYNDDGLTYWVDYDSDNVTLTDFLYRNTDMILLQHGMEGDLIKLDYDVDPWTYYGRSGNVVDIHVDRTGFAEFWDTIGTYNGAAPYDMTSRNIMNDWDTNKQLGGCACYIGTDSKRKIIARDYYGDWLAAGNSLQVRWAGNYFGPWHQGTWPGSAEILFNDWATGGTAENVLLRPIRKDNTLNWNQSTYEPFDYADASWDSSTRENNYDIYQDQFRFRYYIKEPGNYTVTMYMTPFSGMTGKYLVTAKRNGVSHGNTYIVSDTQNSDSITWSVYLQTTDLFELFFYALGSENSGAAVDVYDGTYTFNGSNSTCQLFIDRIEFLRKDYMY